MDPKATKKAADDAWYHHPRTDSGPSFLSAARRKHIEKAIRLDERAQILATPIDIKVQHQDDCAANNDFDGTEECDCQLDTLRSAYILAKHRLDELGRPESLTDEQRIARAAELIAPLANRLLAPAVVEALEGLTSDLETILDPLTDEDG